MKENYLSNRLENLCDQLANNIKVNNHQIFQKEIIVTQTAGMNEWLKTELAQRNGIMANYEFHTPDSLFFQLHRLVGDKHYRHRIDSVKYKIYELLDDDAFKISFPEVAAYYQNMDKRRFDLSTKICDLFDQYQVYRPEMIEDWFADKTCTENAAEEWQRWLWRKIDIEPKADMRKEMIHRLEIKQELIGKIFPVISFFGVNSFTQFHLDFYNVLSEYTTVYFYLCFPSHESDPKNELFNSFGSKARELMHQFNLEKVEENGFVKPCATTNLTQLQHQILDDETEKSAFTEDDTIQINSCYTPAREVECLYNFLLDQFTKDKSLRPRDVLVMTTDIDKYAPYVKAVFKNAPVNIPFQISGAANNSGNTIVAALEQLFMFAEQDFTSEKVISLLEQNRIKQRYEVNDCGYIRAIVQKANIRFGLENKEEDDSRFVSWEYGLDKIVLGYALLTDDEYEGMYPFKDAEASASYDLLRLKLFVSDLENLIKSQKIKRKLSEWKTFLFEEVLGRMVYVDDFNKDDRDELSSIYKALSFMDHIDDNQDLAYPIFLAELKSKLFRESFELNLNTGRVCISSAIQVRGLSHKVICFMGLDNGAFPRQDRYMGFDLLGDRYLPGDRSKKETDKSLFLDTIMATREKLYLSYIGQSAKDNTEIPPSIVVDTLIDYTGIKAVQHPLHGFSSRYQSNDKRLFTYLYQGNTSLSEIKEIDSKELSELSVYSFIKFFEHPIEWYFNTILGIRYDESNDTLPETELFALDGLQQWFVKNDLIRVSENLISDYIEREIKEGKLPLKNMARLSAEKIQVDILELKKAYDGYTCGIKEQKIVIDLHLDNIQISGIINGVYDRKYVGYAFSENAKYQVRAWINTLMLFAMEKIDSSVFLNSKGIPTNYDFLSKKDAETALKKLLKYIKDGMITPLKFTLKAFLDFPAKTGRTTDSSLKAFQNEAYPNDFSPFPANKYMQRLFEEDYFEPIDDDDLNTIETIANLLKMQE